MAKDRLNDATEFAEKLSAGLGDNLRSAAAFGTRFRTGYAPSHQTLNVLIILNDTNPEGLRPVEPAMADWAKQVDEPPLIFARDGWLGSTDVFPIEIEEMREAHELLLGEDPFDAVSTSRDDVRQELEREVRGKLLRLRAFYAAGAPDGSKLTRLLLDSASPFMVLLRATIRMNGDPVPSDLKSQVEHAASIAGFPSTAFDWSLAKLSGHTVPKLTDYDPIAIQYLRAVEQLASYVDQH